MATTPYFSRFCLLLWTLVLLIGCETSKPASTTAPPYKVPSNEPPNLDWPLPPPSSRWTFPATFLAEARTFGQADERLTKMLVPAGYETYAYYAIPGGFALVTQLEQIDEEARPKAPRWSTTVTSKGLLERLREMILPSEGHFRVLVFAFTPNPVIFDTNTAGISQSRAETMLDRGAGSLGASFGKSACSPDCRLTVLVYEYKKDDISRPAVLVRPSLVHAIVQLQNTHVKLHN